MRGTTKSTDHHPAAVMAEADVLHLEQGWEKRKEAQNQLSDLSRFGFENEQWQFNEQFPSKFGLKSECNRGSGSSFVLGHYHSLVGTATRLFFSLFAFLLLPWDGNPEETSNYTCFSLEWIQPLMKIWDDWTPEKRWCQPLQGPQMTTTLNQCTKLPNCPISLIATYNHCC